ncbi:tight adherence protein B [Pseudosporangium ferrugineum]|uniref:Tight adherence protein B n=1 Tax=Pseudosporangium ferrugineum TaxID=439699 RepID=A0A2T0S7M3_9ACTN|nr:hypothetical protein [Pseudosporangium ferrugineum]PRY29427.1 tight adherence protein B [Pseudosporangium ferrugineum]
MTVWPWLAATALLTTAAAIAAWPARGSLGRLGPSARPAPGPAAVHALAARSPRRFLATSAVAAAALATLSGGPAAGFVACVYAALGARALSRRATRRRAAEARARDLDELTALAADLRAGLPGSRASAGLPSGRTDLPGGRARAGIPGGRARAGLPGGRARAGFSGARAHDGLPGGEAGIGGRLGELTATAERLAERTGAPMADLIERIETDARAADRAVAAAAAQVAGAQATAVLLAALPAGGIALGYGMGADPLRILLRTPLGGACAVGAVLLQVAGLLWAERLVSGPFQDPAGPGR